MNSGTTSRENVPEFHDVAIENLSIIDGMLPRPVVRKAGLGCSQIDSRVRFQD